MNDTIFITHVRNLRNGCLSFGARKPLVGVSDQVGLRQACSATKARKNIEILHVA